MAAHNHSCCVSKPIIKEQVTTDIFPHTVIVMDRYLGFMVSSATALVKFLCVIGRKLVKIIIRKEKY